MADDLISRRAAIDAVSDACFEEQRTGTWLVAETHSNWSDFDTFICTNCDAKFEKFEATKFCPNCGARMVDCINVRFVGES